MIDLTIPVVYAFKIRNFLLNPALFYLFIFGCSGSLLLSGGYFLVVVCGLQELQLEGSRAQAQ